MRGYLEEWVGGENKTWPRGQATWDPQPLSPNGPDTYLLVRLGCVAHVHIKSLDDVLTRVQAGAQERTEHSWVQEANGREPACGMLKAWDNGPSGDLY